MQRLTHFNEQAKAIMADVFGRKAAVRTSCAQGEIALGAEFFQMLQEGRIPKEEVLAAARIAGMMAVKKTSDLLPLSQPLVVTDAAVDFDFLPDACAIRVRCTVRTEVRTGAEMEALTGVSAALLTIYDMGKAVSRKMVISDVHLVPKTGAGSGGFFSGEEGERG